jgi:hypothetical protein
MNSDDGFATVTTEDYPSLTLVPASLWNDDLNRPTLGRCDVQPGHGKAWKFMRTPDGRAIALCERCYIDVLWAQGRKV